MTFLHVLEIFKHYEKISLNSILEPPVGRQPARSIECNNSMHLLPIFLYPLFEVEISQLITTYDFPIIECKYLVSGSDNALLTPTLTIILHVSGGASLSLALLFSYLSLPMSAYLKPLRGKERNFQYKYLKSF